MMNKAGIFIRWGFGAELIAARREARIRMSEVRDDTTRPQITHRSTLRVENVGLTKRWAISLIAQRDLPMSRASTPLRYAP